MATSYQNTNPSPNYQPNHGVTPASGNGLPPIPPGPPVYSPETIPGQVPAAGQVPMPAAAGQVVVPLASKIYVPNRSHNAFLNAATVSPTVGASSTNYETTLPIKNAEKEIDGTQGVEDVKSYSKAIDKEIAKQKKESKPKGPGCNPFAPFIYLFNLIMGFFNLIKNLLLTLLFLFFVSIVVAVVTLIYRPPLLWNPIKSFLNNDIVNPEVKVQDNAEVYKKINSLGLKNQPVILTDSELTSVIREYNLLGDKCYAATIDKGLRFFINLDDTERPLWFIVDTKLNNNNRFVISKAGFGRLDTPEQLTTILTDTMGQLFKFLEQQVTADNATIAFQQILDKTKTDKNLQLKKVELQPSSTVLYYQINTPVSVTPSVPEPLVSVTPSVIP